VHLNRYWAGATAALASLAGGAGLAASAPKAPARKTAAPAPAPKKPPAEAATPGLRVAADKRVELDATVAKREHDDVLMGAIEYLLVTRGGKSYESVFETQVKADALDRALKQVGLKPGGPPKAEDAPPTGAGVKLSVQWKDEAGKDQQAPAEEMVLDSVENKPLSGLQWVYTGSKVTEDPATNKKVLMAMQTNNLISTHREDPTVLLMNPLPGASGHRYKRNEARLPKAGTAVKLVFSPGS
jgi:hypothetical protein